MNHSTPPQFFQVRDAMHVGRIPRAERFSAALTNEPCPACGTEWQRLTGPATCCIAEGEVWTDVIGVPDWSLMLVGQRVISALQQLRATGFKPWPVHIDVGPERLRNLPRPDYYYLEVTGQIAIDVKAGDGQYDRRCPLCPKMFGNIRAPNREVPVPHSWDGSDIFGLHPCIRGQVFCTRRVLELARSERWTNFRFDPMDVIQQHAVHWPGIDYLGQTWPPIQWYPDSPSAGKHIDEWIAQYMSDDSSQALPAKFALVDLGAAAVPALSRLLEESAERAKKRAANALGLIHRNGTVLPESLREKIRPLVSENLAAQLK